MEHEDSLSDLLVHSASEIGLFLSERQVQQFLIYLKELLQWNQVTNLTSITDPQEIIIKHFVDSLTGLAAFNFPPHSTVIDVGTGAGFPGIPLKIARNDIQLILIEPTQKKCSFLHSIIGILKLNNTGVFTGTIRQYAAQREFVQGDVITVRALRLEEIEESAITVLKKTGKLLLYGAEKAINRLASKLFAIESEKSFSLPKDQGHRVITVLSPVTLS